MNARDQLARKGHTIAQRKDDGGTLHCTKCRLVFTDTVGGAASYQLGRPGYDLPMCGYTERPPVPAIAAIAAPSDLVALEDEEVPDPVVLSVPVKRGPGRPRKATPGGR